MLETKKRKNVGLDTENKTKKVISNTLLRIILIAATILVYSTNYMDNNVFF